MSTISVSVDRDLLESLKTDEPGSTFSDEVRGVVAERDRLRDALGGLLDAISAVDYEGTEGDVEELDEARREGDAALLPLDSRPSRGNQETSGDGESRRSSGHGESRAKGSSAIADAPRPPEDRCICIVLNDRLVAVSSVWHCPVHGAEPS